MSPVEAPKYPGGHNVGELIPLEAQKVPRGHGIGATRPGLGQ